MLSICEALQHSKTLLTILGWAPLAAGLEVVHYFGVFLLVGSVAFVDLRVLGLAARRRSLSELSAQIFPAAWIGLAMIVVSGFLMFTTSAADYYRDPTFHMKMLVTLGAVVFAAIVQKSAPGWERSGGTPILAKAVALVCFVLLFLAILEGNLVPAISGIG